MVSLKQLDPLKPQTLNVMVDCETSYQIKIPTSQCIPGNWKMLNRQYDGRSFSYNSPFEVRKKTALKIIKPILSLS